MPPARHSRWGSLGNAGSDSKPLVTVPKLWVWVFQRTDWLAVLCCIPLSAGLILYCVPVSQAHGDTKQLLRLASGGQSSLSWLATVYAVTLGITLPLTIVSILYSLLLVAASIYVHSNMYPEEERPQRLQRHRTQQQAPPQQKQQHQQQQEGPGQPSTTFRAMLHWRRRKSSSAPSSNPLQPLQPPSGAASDSGQPPHVSPGKAQSLPIGFVAAAPAPSAPSVPDLANTLKSDKAGGLWERALGLALGPPGMQSVLSMLGSSDSPGPLGARKAAGAPQAPPVVDITKLKSPVHRRMPSMALARRASDAAAAAAAGAVNGSRWGPSPSLRSWTVPELGPAGLTAAGLPGSSAGARGQQAGRGGSDDMALPDVEKGLLGSSLASAAGTAGAAGRAAGTAAAAGAAALASGATTGAAAAAAAAAPGRGGSTRAGTSQQQRQQQGGWVRTASTAVRQSLVPITAYWQRIGRRRGRAGAGGAAAGGSAAAGDSTLGHGAASGSPHSPLGPQVSPEELQRRQQEAAAAKVYKSLRWMLLSLISANTATLVWLIILLVATGAWLICSQAVKEVAQETQGLNATAMGTYNAALGLGATNTAAVSTFAQLFGTAFLTKVNAATGGQFNFTSYAQLEAVANQSAATLGGAAVESYDSAVADPGVVAIVEPQFYSQTNATGLPCPSTCLNFRYFSFLESGACICDQAQIAEVADLADGTVDKLSLSLAGLALMILSIIVLLLRFATYLGQVRARWAARPALQLYAAHREEVALRRRMRAGGRPMPTAHTYSF